MKYSSKLSNYGRLHQQSFYKDQGKRNRHRNFVKLESKTFFLLTTGLKIIINNNKNKNNNSNNNNQSNDQQYFQITFDENIYQFPCSLYFHHHSLWQEHFLYQYQLHEVRVQTPNGWNCSLARQGSQRWGEVCDDTFFVLCSRNMCVIMRYAYKL